VDVEFRHQKPVEKAVAVVGPKDDYRSTGRRLRDEVRMWHIEGSAVSHANRERTERLEAER
jgi:hypothetical protein